MSQTVPNEVKKTRDTKIAKTDRRGIQIVFTVQF